VWGGGSRQSLSWWAKKGRRQKWLREALQGPGSFDIIVFLRKKTKGTALKDLKDLGGLGDGGFWLWLFFCVWGGGVWGWGGGGGVVCWGGGLCWLGGGGGVGLLNSIFKGGYWSQSGGFGL